MSEKLFNRLRHRRKYTLRACENYDQKHYSPKHQYGAAFGAEAAVFYLADDINLKEYESKMITIFYETYGSIPVGNNAWSKFVDNGVG